MKLVSNTGKERVINLIRPWLKRGHQLDMATPEFSLFAFAEVATALSGLKKSRLVLPPEEDQLALLGSPADRAARNRLQTHWLARRCAEWLSGKVELRRASGAVPQSAVVLRDSEAQPQQGVLGSFAFTTDGLGITPGNPLSLIQASETPDESRFLSTWFDAQWTALNTDTSAQREVIEALQSLAVHRDPFSVYALILYHLFLDTEEDLDEERIVKSATGIRNKKTPRHGSETRYDRLMRRIIREGVKSRVLMLSATPVNNRMADLRNQIAFATEGDDTALLEQGIASIDGTTRLAQKQFNRWLDLDEAGRSPWRLVEMLGFDYFTLLDRLTIARSRKHIEKYYGIAETGRFPDRLRPINIKADVDLAGQFPSIRDINLDIRRLNLAAYAPLRYVLPRKQAAYDKKYSTEIRGGEGFFRQADREESLIHLLRVNVLKRMESAVPSFALTIERQLQDVKATLDRIGSPNERIQLLNF